MNKPLTLDTATPFAFSFNPRAHRAGGDRHAARLRRARRLWGEPGQRRDAAAGHHPGGAQHARRLACRGRHRAAHPRGSMPPDLSDCPPAKRLRGKPSMRIGDAGPMGRILTAGEPGAEIVPELAPLPGELVVDKPGKGGHVLWRTGGRAARARHHPPALHGVTTEVCVQTSMREANDRGRVPDRRGRHGRVISRPTRSPRCRCSRPGRHRRLERHHGRDPAGFARLTHHARACRPARPMPHDGT